MPTNGSGDAYNAGVVSGPAEEVDEVARAEQLVAEAEYTAERLQTKLAKAEDRLKDAKTASAEATSNVKQANKVLTEVRRQRRDGGQR